MVDEVGTVTFHLANEGREGKFGRYRDNEMYVILDATDGVHHSLQFDSLGCDNPM